MQAEFNAVRDIPLSLIVAILLFREMSASYEKFVAKRDIKGNSGNGKSGDQGITFWKSEMKDQSTAALNEVVVPVLSRQTALLENQVRILEGITTQQTKISDSQIRIETSVGQGYPGHERRRGM